MTKLYKIRYKNYMLEKFTYDVRTKRCATYLILFILYHITRLFLHPSSVFHLSNLLDKMYVVRGFANEINQVQVR